MPTLLAEPDVERINGLIAECRPGFTLPQPFYTDPEIFQRDLERIFYRHWLMAGHVAQLPEPGSYFLYEIAGESIIVIRDRENEIHADARKKSAFRPARGRLSNGRQRQQARAFADRRRGSP